MSKNAAHIPPPNVHPELVAAGQDNLPRPGRSFNLEQAANVAPLDTSNAPEDPQPQQQAQQPTGTSPGGRPEHATIAQAAREPEGGWEAGDEEKVMKLATSAGSGGADPDQENNDGGEGAAQRQQQPQQQDTTYHPASEEELYEAMDVLNNRLPPELVVPIIEYAEYYMRASLGSRHEERGVSSSGSAVYLTCRIPDFEAFDSETEGRGGRKEEVENPDRGEKRKVEVGRQGRVRRLVFKIRSHDQGWTSNKGMGSYVGSFSWLDVEVYRKKSAVLVEGAVDAPGTSMAEKTVESEKGKEKAGASVVVHDDTPMDAMVKIDGPLLLQCNVHGKRESTEHVIIWDHAEDELDEEDPEKWEEGEVGNWHKGGRLGRNGAFVRKLRGGDELRVVMRCKYPGWSCVVDSCEVEAYWAV